jgi:hypothetical protein
LVGKSIIREEPSMILKFSDASSTFYLDKHYHMALMERYRAMNARSHFKMCLEAI